MVESDPDPLIWQLLLQLILILLNAVFACAEIAVISISEAKLEKLSDSGNKRAKRLLSLTSQPARFLATIQIGITLAGFMGSAFAADSFAQKLVDLFVRIGIPLRLTVLRPVSVVIITLALSYITLVLGELVPKRIAMQKAEAIGLGLSGLVYAISKILKPIVWLLTVSTNGMLRLFGFDPDAQDDGVTEEEIRIMVDASSSKGEIDEEEREFIHNIFEFDDLTAQRLMTHRTDVTMLWMEDKDSEWEQTIIESRHSIYPICKDSQDNIVGVLNTKDYFRLADRSRENVMANAVKAPQFVPENVSADILLRNMKKNRNHFAVVMDEYSGMSGIITINDLLEQLVGDFDDETDESEDMTIIEQIDENTWNISGFADMEEVEEAIGKNLPRDEYETFAGMVLSILGYIPEDGSTPEIEAHGLYIQITSMKDHRMETAIVKVIDQDSDTDTET